MSALMSALKIALMSLTNVRTNFGLKCPFLKPGLNVPYFHLPMWLCVAVCSSKPPTTHAMNVYLITCLSLLVCSSVALFEVNIRAVGYGHVRPFSVMCAFFHKHENSLFDIKPLCDLIETLYFFQSDDVAVSNGQ